MSYKLTRHILYTALAAGILAGVTTGPAEAQRRTLLEQIFPDAAERIRERRAQRLGGYQEEISEPVPIKKISGPSYYTYRTEKLVTISLASLVPDTVAEEENPATDAGVEAVQGDTGSGDAAAVALDTETTGSTSDAGEAPRHVLTREALEGWSMEVEEDIASAIRDHYRENPGFLWVGMDMRPNGHARGVMKQLAAAGDYGLDPEDYRVGFSPESGMPGEEPVAGGESDENAAPIKAAVTESAVSPEDALASEAARFEIALTASVLRYGADAAHGAVNPNLISGYHDFPNYRRDYAGILEKIAAADLRGPELAGLHPDHKAYDNLVAELANLRAEASEAPYEPVAGDTFIKPGQSHAELPKLVAAIRYRGSDALRETHAETFASYDGRQLYDEPLVALVRDFQKENDLGVDGIVGRNTLAKVELATSADKIKRTRLALERLRWHPHSLGSRHVFINQPAYQAAYIENDRVKLSMRAIVGKPSNQTYFFHDKVEVVEVNPYWNVPRSIMINQKLSTIRSNPGYLASNGYEVITARGVTDPYSVDWNSGSLDGVQIRQRPGSSNALGELKILFPNRHAIYMHDTPDRHLFGRPARAYSSGCVRLQEPRAMAAAVLGSDEGYVGSQIASGENRSIPVKRDIPVYVAYFTAWPDDNGKVNYYSDVYGRDKALEKAIDAISRMRASSIKSMT